MFDIGVNLDHPAYLDALDDFRHEYHAAGVEGIICISSNMEEADSLAKHCASYRDMHYTLGCHPHHASTWRDEHSKILQHKFAQQTQAVAVGECGLDFNRNYSTPAEQLYAFEAQLDLAKRIEKPVYLHERDAFDDMVSRLKRANLLASGVIHCFTGNTAQLKAYLDLGLYVGITGWLLDERRNADLSEAVKYLPIDRLLLETDAPYLTPRNIRPRPKRNHPKYLAWIAEEIARIHGVSSEEVKQATSDNTKRLFFSRAHR